MKKKILGIFVCMLLIATALPVVGTMKIRTASINDGKELSVSTNRLEYREEEEMAITVENTGNESVNFFVFPKIEILNEEGEKIFPSETEQGNWTLKPGEKEIYVWDQKDLEGQQVDPGNITIKTVSELTFEPFYIPWILDIGYVILVAGDVSYVDHRCYKGPREIYDDLISIGYTDARIQFLHNKTNGVDPKVDDIASEEKVEEAIKVWAAARVSRPRPLFIIMFDHGGVNSFCVANDVGGDYVYASDLRSWIDELYDDTHARIDVWYMACYSGSFIDELSKAGRVTITSTCANLRTAGGPAPYYEYFTLNFWPKIVAGDSWKDAFNYACYHAHAANSVNIPLLDDNGDGVGHGLYDCSGVYEGDLPHDGDGNRAMRRYMGHWRQKEIWWELIHVVCPSRYYPDKEKFDTIPIWAVIETEESLDNVSACILDPNYEPEGCFDEIPCEYFEMTDEDNDGEWTVGIPREEFTKYEATDFTILVNAKTEDGESTTPLGTNIYLREASPDYEKPFVNIDNPRDGQVVGGTLNIKGRASDNIELDRIELYLGDNLFQTIVPPPSSHYYFESSIELEESPEGIAQLQVMAYDTSGNMNVNVREVTIVGSPYRPDAPSGPSKGTVGEEYPYTAVTIDPQNDKVSYMFNWGDDTTSEWLGPFESGETCEESHTWEEEGEYDIKVKAKDIYGKESDWSDPLPVTMPKNKPFNFNFNLLSWLFERFPNAFPILRR